MILRSQPTQSVAPYSNCFLMKEDKIPIQKNNKILPNNIDELVSSPSMEANSTQKRVIGSEIPVLYPPPSHIQQETLLSININNQPSPYKYNGPRKHKIFNYHPQNKELLDSRDHFKNTYSFGNIAVVEPKQNTHNYSQNNSLTPANQTIYQTVRSMKSKTSLNRYGTINSMINQEQFDNMEFDNLQQNKKINSASQFKQQPTYSINAFKSTPTTYQSLSTKINNAQMNTKDYKDPFKSSSNSASFNPTAHDDRNQFFKTTNKNQNEPQIYDLSSQAKQKNNQPGPSLNTLIQNCQKVQKFYSNPLNTPSSPYNHLTYNKYNSQPFFNQTSLYKEQPPFQKNYIRKVIDYGQQQKTKKENNLFEPIKSFSPPFSQSQRKELQSIPQRIVNIQILVLEQDKKLNEMNEKLSDFKKQDNSTQKHLLVSLLNMEQQLNQKQKEITNNLERINKMKPENNVPKQQILKNKLELERTKRIEALLKENSMLYHKLAKNQTNDSQSMSQSQSESLEQYNNYDKKNSRVKENSIVELSPFAINPDRY